MNFLMVFDFTQFWLDGRPGNEYFWISHKIFGHLIPMPPLGVHPQWFETTWNRYERILLLCIFYSNLSLVWKKLNKYLGILRCIEIYCTIRKDFTTLCRRYLLAFVPISIYAPDRHSKYAMHYKFDNLAITLSVVSSKQLVDINFVRALWFSQLHMPKIWK